ncbi:MAG: hypothetical protein ACTSR2_03070 [Candidatus Hodarchaeales archaeon]
MDSIIKKQRRMIAADIINDFYMSVIATEGERKRIQFLLEQNNLEQSDLTKYLIEAIDDYQKASQKLINAIEKYKKQTKMF